MISLSLAVGTTSWFTQAAYSQTDEEKARKPTVQTIRILGFNDFHGNLEPQPEEDEVEGVQVRGAAYLDAYLDRFEKINPPVGTERLTRYLSG